MGCRRGEGRGGGEGWERRGGRWVEVGEGVIREMIRGVEELGAGSGGGEGGGEGEWDR